MVKESDASDSSQRGPVERHNARIGMALFLIYVLLYAGFMGLSAFAPQVMSQTAVGGANVAIIYGLGLILAAVVLALIYTVVCRGGER
ncbi:MAG TPA: DUF485 domain-containing protein [Tepidisphaeraceae bacterium]|jgi:uncharacterized membrane protein (DUF485 family)